MKLLIFDTETTGLPVDRNKQAIKEPNNWPHIVSISWVVLDADSNKIESKNSFIVKPINWTIPLEATKVHGITNEKAMLKGSPLSEVMEQFSRESYDYLVAHNIQFDHTNNIQILV